MDITLSGYLKQQYAQHIDDAFFDYVKANDISLFDSCELAVRIYRIQREIYITPHSPFSKYLKLLSLLQKQFACCEIYYSAEIGNNFSLLHGIGTIIGSTVKIGDNVTIWHDVTIGTKYDTTKEKPVIHNDAIIYSGARVLGDIIVGAGAVIAANAVVVTSVGQKEIFAGVPAKKIGVVRSGKYKLPPGAK